MSSASRNAFTLAAAMSVPYVEKQRVGCDQRNDCVSDKNEYGVPAEHMLRVSQLCARVPMQAKSSIVPEQREKDVRCTRGIMGQ